LICSPGDDLLVLADDTANPKFAAADMLAQAEHGSGHERVWLVTTSAKILKAVEREFPSSCPNWRVANSSSGLDRNTWLIQVASVVMPWRWRTSCAGTLRSQSRRDGARRVTVAS